MSSKPRRSRRQSRRHLKPSSTISAEPSSSASKQKEPRIQTPARVLHSTMSKSPASARGGFSSRTPSPGKMKLTTKNLPILF